MNVIKRFFINGVASSLILPERFRVPILKSFNINIGNKVVVRGRCFFNSIYVNIGDDSFINYYCQFHSGYESIYPISIGKRCFIGMNVNFCTISHEIGSSGQRAGKNFYGQIIVGDGVWIGANSVILPGVQIGNGSIIAAGSIVNKDCESNYLYAGNPAKKIKKLDLIV